MPELTDLFTPALIVALFTWLRSDIRKLHDRLNATEKNFNDRFDATARSFNERVDEAVRGFNARIDATAGGFNERLGGAQRDTSEHIDKRFDAMLHETGELRERMAKMEGSLDGFLAGRRDRDAA